MGNLCNKQLETPIHTSVESGSYDSALESLTDLSNDERTAARNMIQEFKSEEFRSIRRVKKVYDGRRKIHKMKIVCARGFISDSTDPPTFRLEVWTVFQDINIADVRL